MIAKGKTVSLVMLITVLSKCLGFVRDMILAHFFGASSISDAYFVAQTIPEFLFSLAEQAISIGFIPIYMEIFHKEGQKRAVRFTNNLSFFGLILVAGIVATVYVFTDGIVQLFASGFSQTANDMAALFVRISVWGMFFRVISAIYTAFLNANNRFTVTALIGIPLNLVTISSVLLAYYLNMPEILGFGIALGYLAQLLIQYPVIKTIKSKIHRKNISFSDPYLRKMFSLFLPVAIGVGANQINILVDRTMASSIEGGISALNYANKVGNILENIVVLSLATVIFPTLSKHAAKKKIEMLSSDIGKSLMTVLLTMLPCAVFVFQYSQEIIQLLFGHGVFDTRATILTAEAMKFYSIGLLFLSFNAILTRAMYSLQKVGFTSISACCSMVVNVALNITLAPSMGVRGLALATSAANIIQTLVLIVGLCRQIGNQYIRLISFEAFKSMTCVLCLGGISCLLKILLEGIFPWLSTMIISVLLSSIVYILLILMLKVTPISEILMHLKSRCMK